MKLFRITFITSAALFLLFNMTWAADHSGHGGHDQNKSETKNDESIAEKQVEGFTMDYTLYSLEKRNRMMKAMDGMKMEGMEMHGMSAGADITNHLMLFIHDAQGKLVSGKVGFVVTGPDGKEFKTLTMGMGGGYGADVSLKQAGEYTIKTKAVIDGKTITDEIKYTVK